MSNFKYNAPSSTAAIIDVIRNNAGVAMQTSVYNTQKPLKGKYKQSPDLALVTDDAKTSGEVASDPFHSKVEPLDGIGPRPVRLWRFTRETI